MSQKKNSHNKAFENAFLIANQDTLQDMSEYSLLKQSVEDIKSLSEEKEAILKKY